MDFERSREEAFQALVDCRDRIDEIDRRILALLNERTTVVERIGAIKRRWAMPIYEPRREEEVFRNISDHNHGPLPPDAAKRVFERLIDEMRNVQRLRMLEEEEK